VYALDVESLGLKEGFTPEDAVKAIKRHTVAKGEVVGTYTLNPSLNVSLVPAAAKSATAPAAAATATTRSQQKAQ
jgi:hypothetical protein